MTCKLTWLVIQILICLNYLLNHFDNISLGLRNNLLCNFHNNLYSDSEVQNDWLIICIQTLIRTCTITFIMTSVVASLAPTNFEVVACLRLRLTNNQSSLPALTRGPGAGAPAVGQAFGPSLLWALRALFLLSPPAREPTEARLKFPFPLPPTSHNTPVIMRGRNKIFRVLMMSSHYIPLP